MDFFRYESMKKIILFILFTTCLYGQIQSGIVTYGLTLGYDEMLSKDERFGSFYEKAQVGAKQISNTLRFNTTVSLFQMNDFMEDENSKWAKMLSGASTVVYSNLHSDQKTRQINSAMGQFLIDYTKKTVWTLEKETKYIDAYLCYKATAEATVVNAKGTFTFPVVAWYCPSIPFSYGPHGYDGLPGLILELTERYITYGAVKVNLSKEHIALEKPKEGKELTEEAFIAQMKNPPGF